MVERISMRNAESEVAAQRVRHDASTGWTPVLELFAEKPTQAISDDRHQLDDLTVRPLLEEPAENM
jgi:hypothetical protein